MTHLCQLMLDGVILDVVLQSRGTLLLHIMRQVLSLLLVLLGWILGACAQTGLRTPPPPAGGKFSLIDGRQEMMSLAGPWRFQPGDNPAWAEPGFDDSNWALVPGNKPWRDAGYADLSGFAWYRFHVELPPDGNELALELADILESYQVFEDGVLLKTLGTFPPERVSNQSHREVVPLLPRARTGRVVTLALRVYLPPEDRVAISGGPYGASTLGTLAPVQHEHELLQDAMEWVLSSEVYLGLLQLLAAVLAGSFYLLRRTEREYL